MTFSLYPVITYFCCRYIYMSSFFLQKSVISMSTKSFISYSHCTLRTANWGWHKVGVYWLVWLDTVLDTWLSWGSHCGCSSSWSLLTHPGPNFTGAWSYNLEFLLIVIKYKMCCCKWWNFSKDIDNMSPIEQNMFLVVSLKPKFWQNKQG
jgi:hypothetical protein